MNRFLRTCALALCCLLSAPAALAQAVLVVHHNANLREKPTTQSAILDHLEPGDELALLGTLTCGFYHQTIILV